MNIIELPSRKIALEAECLFREVTILRDLLALYVPTRGRSK
jgi:hypothetical protein